MLEGNAEGFLDLTIDGRGEGLILERRLGLFDGKEDDKADGFPVGTEVLRSDGSFDGKELGLLDNRSDGFEDLTPLGLYDGLFDGITEGK